MFNVLLNLFKSKKRAQAVGAILYPDKIMIETRHQVKDGFWITTDRISTLPVDAGDRVLGRAVRKHLHLSKVSVPNPKEEGFRKLQEQYKKATGMTTLKAQMAGARYVFILNEKSRIQCCPSRNGGATGDKKGYHFKPADNTELLQTASDHELGQQLRETWEKCD